MAEKEAMQRLEMYRKWGFSQKLNEAVNIATKVLGEIQQYREIGTVDELKEPMNFYRNVKESSVRELIEKCAEYEKIGTINECRAAVEKQKPKKPEDVEYDYSYFICPVCGDGIYVSDDYESHKFCLNCGQAIDWSEEE